MSKGLWLVAGAVGLVWLVAQGNGTPARKAPGYAPGYAPAYAPITTAVPGRYGAEVPDNDDEEAEDRAEEVRQAKQEFEDAADELRSAVAALRYKRWDGQMSTIRSRLDDAEDALSELENLRPGDPAVQSARDEVDGMRSHMSRLHHENWRNVRPDLANSASAIEDEAGTVSEDED